MPSEGALRAAGFAAFALLVAAGAFAAWELVPATEAKPRAVSIALYEPRLNVSAGQTVGVAIGVTNAGTAARDVELRVEGAPLAPATRALPLEAGETKALWLPVSIPLDAAPGEYRVRVSANPGLAQRDVFSRDLTLRVLPAADGLKPGDTATVRFVAMFPDGRVWDGSLPFSDDEEFPRHAPFVARAEPFTYVVGATEPLVGSTGAMLGMQEGEARQVAVPAHRAFGNASITDQFPRNTVIPLDLRTLPGAPNATRAEFTRWLDQTGQKPMIGWKLNETPVWRLVLGGSPIPVKVKLLSIGLGDQDLVTFEFPKVDERFTLFTQFPNGTRITAKGDTSWVVRTEPTVPPDTAFTYVGYWPEGTRITACSPACTAGYVGVDNVTLTHLDGSWVGRQFTYPNRGLAVGAYNVSSVDDDFIVATAPNLHPYAGLEIVYQIRVEKITRS